MRLDRIRSKIKEGQEVCAIHNGARYRIDSVKSVDKIVMAHLYTDEVKSVVSTCLGQFRDGIHEGGRNALRRELRASREILKHSMALYCPDEPGLDPEDPK